MSLANMGSKTQKRSMGERIRGAVGGVSMKKNSKSSDRNIEPVARTFSTLGHEPQLSSYIVKTVFNQSQVRRCCGLGVIVVCVCVFGCVNGIMWMIINGLI